MYLIKVSESDVISIIKDLDNKKASGVDGIPVRFIKAEPDSIGILITRLVNCITSGIFPELWKLAVVIPIQKTKFGVLKCLIWLCVNLLSLSVRLAYVKTSLKLTS